MRTATSFPDAQFEASTGAGLLTAVIMSAILSSKTVIDRGICRAGPDRPCSFSVGRKKAGQGRPTQDTHPRKTMAGSRTMTRRTLRRLDRTQIATIAPPVIGRSCQGV